MPKIDTSTLPRPEPVTEDKTFTDALAPGQEIALTLTSTPDYGEALKVQTLSERYIKDFSGEGKVPIQVGGKDVEIPPSLCVVIALVQTLEQPQADGSGRYSFEEWARISVAMPNAFAEIVGSARNLMAKATTPRKTPGGQIAVPND